MLAKLENGASVSIPDTTIDKYVTKYNLTREEAMTLWLEDNDYLSNPVVEELEEKAKKNKISRDARKISTKTERKAREKKENPLKKAIIDAVFDGLRTNVEKFNEDICSFTVTNDEKYIDLIIGNRNFTINLVEHRGEKK